MCFMCRFNSFSPGQKAIHVGITGGLMKTLGFRPSPDHFQIVPRLGGPLFQISRFLDFQKNLERGTGTPFQILATISRFPYCSRFWNQIPMWLQQLLSERAEDWVPNRVGFLGSKNLIRPLYAASIRPICALKIKRQ